MVQGEGKPCYSEDRSFPKPNRKKLAVVRGLDGPRHVDGMITYLKDVQLALRFKHDTTTRLLHFLFE